MTQTSTAQDRRSATFRILAADELAAQGLEFIRAQSDADVDVKTGLSEDELARIVPQYDGLIVRSGAKVTAKVLASPGRLQVIARAGVGVDNIDLDAATAAGVLVLNAAEASTLTTAEHAFALILAVARHIPEAHESMCQGQWDRGRFRGRQLAGKKLGVIGFGRIGRAIAQRALAFDMGVLAYDPFINAASMMDGLVKMSPIEQLLPQVDVITCHVPLSDQTRGLLNDQTLALCRDGVLLVNASRGGVVDERALCAALKSGKVAGAALDVFETEPLAADSPLRSQPGMILTPHLGASTVEAQEAISTDAAAALLAYLRGQEVRGAVNVTGLRLDLDPLQSCFVDLASRMARLLAPMASRGISAVTISITSEPLAAAATTIERISLIGLLQSHLDVPLNLVNVRHVAEQRGIAHRTVISESAAASVSAGAAGGTGGPQIAIDVEAPGRRGDLPHRIVGRVYDDMRPRVVEINGYHMDMVPAGHMVLIQNEDRPGMIGIVGVEFGRARINIADMAISRRQDTALMLLKIDNEPPEDLLSDLRRRKGIRKVVLVRLPDTNRP